MDITKIKVSVIVPSFNRENTIERCLESVLNQTFMPFEIVVVDDCSTDRTIDIIKHLDTSLIKIIKLEKNSGAQVARNVGIKAAKGDWIAFLDSDDEWLPFKLEKQIDILKLHNFDKNIVIHGDCYKMDISKGLKTKWALHFCNGASIYEELLSHPGPMFQALLVSKIALHQIGYLDEKVPSYQEWDTSISLSKICEFIHIRTPLFIYHFHDEETISKNPTRDINGYTYIIEKYKNDISPQIYYQHIRTIIQKAYSYGAWDLAAQLLLSISAKSILVHLQIIILKIRLHPQCLKYYFKKKYGRKYFA